MRYPKRKSQEREKNDYSYKLELLFNNKMLVPMYLRGSNMKAASLFFILIYDLRAHHKPGQAGCSCWDV